MARETWLMKREARFAGEARRARTRISCLALFASCLATVSPTHAFKIVEPAEGATLTAGSTVTA
ncbi:MAG: hypothetical protein OEV77_14060, partial [Nitrospira sp.]|nr:hypothetical protein [Nitrospira sp.]